MAEQMKYGLLESDIGDIIGILKNFQKINKLILFGSRAKGTYNEGSDIDLAISGKDLKLNDIIDALIEMEELLLPNKFDLIIYESIEDQSLKEHIDRIGVVLYERTTSSD
jgi:predicted nucleotidyltransferase